MKKGQKNEHIKRCEVEREIEIRFPHGLDRDAYAKETLERYSGCSIDQFQKHILLTNFPDYVKLFAKKEAVEVICGPVLNVAHSTKNEMTIIDFQIGAPMAALIIDILSYIKPICVIMLGLCGGLHRSQKIGDFLLPVAAIRDEGASYHYMPQQVPSLPSFLAQEFISEELRKHNISFMTGVMHTTDYRMWEFDEAFIEALKEEKASAIDMECSALFSCAFRRKVPIGALMLISDLPLEKETIKTKALAEEIFSKHREQHIELGTSALQCIKKAVVEKNLNIRRYSF